MVLFPISPIFLLHISLTQTPLDHEIVESLPLLVIMAFYRYLNIVGPLSKGPLCIITGYSQCFYVICSMLFLCSISVT